MKYLLLLIAITTGCAHIDSACETLHTSTETHVTLLETMAPYCFAHTDDEVCNKAFEVGLLLNEAMEMCYIDEVSK